MGKDVREIEQWPSPLLSEWMAYDQLEPLPDPAWQTGLLASIMVNLWSKSRTRPDDFIPRVKTSARKSDAELLAKFRGAAAAANAQAKRS